MLSYAGLCRKPVLFRSFTGLSVREFDRLYVLVEGEYVVYERRRLDRKDRVNALGQGRDFKLDLRDRLLMLLVYYRQYVTLTLTGFLFDLDVSNVYRNIQHIEPLVKLCMPLPEKLYKKTKRINTIEELLEYFPDKKAFLDATEQEIPRPKNRRRRKTYYSGKKKKHTVKTQLLVNKKGLILHKTRYERGSKHDYSIWKKTHPKIPPNIEVDTDLGYQGIQKDYPQLKTHLPVKKRKGKRLSKKDKKHNRKHNKERVLIEHVIGKLKKYKIIGQEFRNKLKHYNNKMDITTGLINFTTMLTLGINVAAYIG